MNDSYYQKIINAAIEVHRELGIGYSEKLYQRAYYHELHVRGFDVIMEHPIRVKYKNVYIGDYFLDLFVDHKMIIEIKTINSITIKEISQTKSYMRASDVHDALIFNFKNHRLEIKRVYHPTDKHVLQ